MAVHQQQDEPPAGSAGRARPLASAPPPAFSAGDLDRLAAEPSPENRAAIGEKVAGAFGSGLLTPAERSLAIAIFTVLSRDAETLVRRRLAESLGYHADPPQGIVRELIFDVLEVATPLLENSAALSDSDLIAVIDRCSREHARVVARRPAVSSAVSNVLAATGDEGVISDLLGNDTAAIAEPTYHLIVDTFGAVPRIMDLVSLRQVLPIAVIERIVTLVSEDARRRILEHSAIPAPELDALMLHAREHLLLTTVLVDCTQDELAAAVQHMHEVHQITATLIVRAACLGNFAMLAAAMGCVAGIRHDDALQLLVHPRDGVSDRFYERCRFRAQHRALFDAVMHLARTYLYKGDKRDRGPFQNRVHRWGAAALGVAQNRIGFDQMITRLLTRSAAIEYRGLDINLIHH